jgi:hypothetical protein
MPPNKSRSAHVSIPHNVRHPPDSPHHGLDHNILVSPPSDDVSGSLRRGAYSTPAPLTRSRSAQDLMAPQDGSSYFFNRGDNNVAPSSRHSSHHPSGTLGMANDRQWDLPVPSLPSSQGYLSAPNSRRPRHEYSRSSDHVPYSSSFNASETSLGACAELVDV